MWIFLQFRNAISATLKHEKMQKQIYNKYTSQREKREAANNASENGSANNRFQMWDAADNTSSKEKREAANNIVKSGKPLTTL